MGQETGWGSVAGRDGEMAQLWAKGFPLAQETAFQLEVALAPRLEVGWVPATVVTRDGQWGKTWEFQKAATQENVRSENRMRRHQIVGTHPKCCRVRKHDKGIRSAVGNI